MPSAFVFDRACNHPQNIRAASPEGETDMDRQIVYPGAIPLDTDLLNIQRATMKSLGYLAQATIGLNTVIDGFTVVPTAPASMTVTVGPGSISTLSTIDQTSFGSLGYDSNPLVKIGSIETYSSFTMAPPSVSGQSVNFLIEASFSEVDGTPVVLPYYNAANPSQSFAGVGNSGSAQNTQRLQKAVLTLLTGTPAATGTQVTPGVSPGAVPVAVITVTYGQGTIGSGNIAAPATPANIPWKLPQLDFRSSTGRSGWQRLPSGVILQWGTNLMTTGYLDSFSFPLTFPNTGLTVVACEGSVGGWGSSPVPTIYGVANVSASGFQASCVEITASGAIYDRSAGFNWIAVGF